MRQNQSELLTLKPRKLLLSIKEAAEVTSMSPSKCREMAHSGEWEAIHIGASLRIVAESLETWVDGQERVA